MSRNTKEAVIARVQNGILRMGLQRFANEDIFVPTGMNEWGEGTGWEVKSVSRDGWLGDLGRWAEKKDEFSLERFLEGK